MFKVLAASLALGALTIPVMGAQAATTLSVSTGQAVPGTVDPNWTVNGNPAVVPVLISPDWFSNGAPTFLNGNANGARWITPIAQFRPAGDFTFATVFQLSNAAANGQLVGEFWSDNRVNRVLLNGTEIYNFSGRRNQFAGPNGVTINQTFSNQGANTLAFEVRNDAPRFGLTATGLLFSGTVSAVPEPGAWLLMILGIGAIGFTMRRSQAQSMRIAFS